jgi:hypothetical protein
MLLSAPMPDQPPTLVGLQKVPPGAIRLNCLRCEKNGRTSCLGVLWQLVLTEEDLSGDGIQVHRLPHPSWHLSIRIRQRGFHNTDAGPRLSIGSKRESVFYTVAPHGVADVNCLRCKRPVTLSAKALGRRADGRTSMLV